MSNKSSKILKCACSHTYQDKLYGKHKRLHNWGPKVYWKNPGYRCTVCGLAKSER